MHRFYLTAFCGYAAIKKAPAALVDAYSELSWVTNNSYYYILSYA
jgi:hypothetical protein